MRYAIVLFLLALAAFGQGAPSSTSAAQGKVPSAVELYKAAAPSVVLIEVYGEDGKVSGSGSGFVVSADGAILTNYHVVAHTKRASVRLANGDAYDDVSVLDLDKRKDIALIKIKAVDLAPLKLGRSASLQVGDQLYALGNPLGVLQNTLSEGILSGIRQADGYRLFQLSAPVSHGSSGSPVFDSHGEVVAIIESMIEEGQNLNLAVPIDYALGMLAAPRTSRTLEAIYEPPEPKSDPEPSVNAAPQLASSARPTDALKTDVFDYLAGKVTGWTKADAEKEFGQPLARRDGFGDPSGMNGPVISDIYKYPSPVVGFSTIELSFARANGTLAAAFLYPQGIVNWEAFRGRLFTLNIRYQRRKAPHGAAYYSYQYQQHTYSFFVDSQENIISVALF